MKLKNMIQTLESKGGYAVSQRVALYWKEVVDLDCYQAIARQAARCDYQPVHFDN